METITSRENAKIKYACRLREEEKLRTADGLFFAEGPKLCLELARGCTLQTLYATEKALAHTPELEAFAGKTVLVTEPVAQKLSGTKTSQDVFGVFEHPGWQAADILAKGRRILALEAVHAIAQIAINCLISESSVFNILHTGLYQCCIVCYNRACDHLIICRT